MDFRQIEAFVNVVRLKSFSKAADAIYLTQPTISSHISSLENELGTKLIDRSGKDIVPTKAGRLFYDYALNLINIRDTAVYKLNEYSNNISGKVELSASTVPCQYIIPELINGFIKEYKNVTFSVNQMDTKDVTESILQKDIEVGIVGSIIENDKLIYKQLHDDKLVLITPNNKRFSEIQSEEISIKEIENESFLFRESGSGTRQEFEKALKKIGISLRTIKTIAHMSGTEAIKQAVSLGVGVSIVSAISVEDYVKFGQIRAFDIKEMDLKRAFYIVHHKSMPMSPLSITFMNYALNYYGN